MGEMAVDTKDGTCCFLCGSYFLDPNDPEALFTHGYEVVCKDCWEDLSEDDRRFYKKAKVDTI